MHDLNHLLICLALILMGGTTCSAIEEAGSAGLATTDEPNNISLSDITALTKVGDMIWGAVAGSVVQLNDKGEVLMSSAIPIPISQVAGIAPYAGGAILVGSPDDNAVYIIHPANGCAKEFLDLTKLNASGLLAGDVLTSGSPESLASDGEFVYVGVKAGFSSSILKIDPVNEKVVAQAWAPGPDPFAMAYDMGSLFVLDGSSKQLRCFDPEMKLSAGFVGVADENVRGISANGAAVQVLSINDTGLQVHSIDVGELISS